MTKDRHIRPTVNAWSRHDRGTRPRPGEGPRVHAVVHQDTVRGWWDCCCGDRVTDFRRASHMAGADDRTPTSGLAARYDTGRP